MSFNQKYNFRDTVGFVTDGAGALWGGKSAYPQTHPVDGNSYGWARTSDLDYRDRNNGSDVRLAGFAFMQDNVATNQFIVQLPAPGTYKIRIALGDFNYAKLNQCYRIYDNTTLLHTGTYLDATAGSHWFDATDVERTSPTDWVTNNVEATYTFATTTFKIDIGDPAALGVGDITALSHLQIVDVPAAFPGGGRVAADEQNISSWRERAGYGVILAATAALFAAVATAPPRHSIAVQEQEAPNRAGYGSVHTVMPGHVPRPRKAIAAFEQEAPNRAGYGAIRVGAAFLITPPPTPAGAETQFGTHELHVRNADNRSAIWRGVFPQPAGSPADAIVVNTVRGLPQDYDTADHSVVFRQQPAPSAPPSLAQSTQRLNAPPQAYDTADHSAVYHKQPGVPAMPAALQIERVNAPPQAFDTTSYSATYHAPPASAAAGTFSDWFGKAEYRYGGHELVIKSNPGYGRIYHKPPPSFLQQPQPDVITTNFPLQQEQLYDTTNYSLIVGLTAEFEWELMQRRVQMTPQSDPNTNSSQMFARAVFPIIPPPINIQIVRVASVPQIDTRPAQYDSHVSIPPPPDNARIAELTVRRVATVPQDDIRPAQYDSVVQGANQGALLWTPPSPPPDNILIQRLYASEQLDGVLYDQLTHSRIFVLIPPEGSPVAEPPPGGGDSSHGHHGHHGGHHKKHRSYPPEIRRQLMAEDEAVLAVILDTVTPEWFE